MPAFRSDSGPSRVDEPQDADRERADLEARLREASLWWSAKARGERLVADRLWLAFRCASCGRCVDRALALPGLDSPEPPYSTRNEAVELVVEASAGRPRGIEESAWDAACRCACGAPPHNGTPIGAALLNASRDGAPLSIHTLLGEPARAARWLDSAGQPRPIELDEVVLSLFDGWAEVATQLPLQRGRVIGLEPTPGVFLFAASDDSELEAAVEATLGDARRLRVKLSVETILSARWPRTLEPLAAAARDGAAFGCVIREDTLIAQLRAWARGRMSADVRSTGGELFVVTDRGEWRLEPSRIAMRLAQRGYPLRYACALELAGAIDALDDRLETLRRLAELSVGSTFEVTGTTAVARRADGEPGETLELEELPAAAGALAPAVLAREAAYLFKAAPPWADPMRVCPCGAAVSLERRLVEWPWRGDEPPRTIRTWGTDEGAQAAEVVALCCDRHVRIPSARALAAAGIDEETLAARLERDIAFAAPEVRALRWTGDDGERALVVQGPLISSVVLIDEKVAALHAALGGPVRWPRPRAELGGRARRPRHGARRRSRRRSRARGALGGRPDRRGTVLDTPRPSTRRAPAGRVPSLVRPQLVTAGGVGTDVSWFDKRRRHDRGGRRRAHRHLQDPRASRTVRARPLPEHDAVLRRVGGLHEGQVLQLAGADQELELLAQSG